MDAIYFPLNVLSSYDSTNTLESFNTTPQTWSNVPIVDADNSVSNMTYNPVGGHLSSGATTSTSGLGLGFAIGGNYTEMSTGLIVLNASNPDSLSWTNETDEVPILSGGEMQYARYGKKGVLIAFGGYSAVCSTSEPYLTVLTTDFSQIINHSTTCHRYLFMI